jgi:predicted nucleic acid-binding protein
MIIVDTNILIGIERGDLLIKKIFEQYAEEEFYISAISIQELYVGLGYSKIKKNKAFYKQQQQVVETIINDFHILEVTEEILRKAGQKQGELLAHGITIDSEDCVVGITAELMNVHKIFTKNGKHFEHFKVGCIDY